MSQTLSLILITFTWHKGLDYLAPNRFLQNPLGSWNNETTEYKYEILQNYEFVPRNLSLKESLKQPMGFPPWATRDASSVNRSHKLVTRSSVDARESINMIRNIIKQVQNYFFSEPWNEIREKLVIRSKAGNRGEFPLTLFSLGSGKKTCFYHFLHMACLQNEQRISKRLPSPLSSKMK